MIRFVALVLAPLAYAAPLSGIYESRPSAGGDVVEQFDLVKNMDLYSTFGSESGLNNFMFDEKSNSLVLSNSLADARLGDVSMVVVKGTISDDQQTITWSHGYRSTLVSPKIPQMEGLYDSYEVGSPKKAAVEQIAISQQGDVLTTWGSVVGMHKFKVDGLILTPLEAASSPLSMWIDQEAKSFKTGDAAEQEVEYFVFTREGETYVTTGSQSGRNEYTLKDNMLVLKGNPQITATLQANNDLVWSHGYTSRRMIQNSKSPLSMWIGAEGKSFKTGDPEENTVDTFVFTREGETYVTTGSQSGRNEYTLKDITLVHKVYPEITATLQENNELVWSHGYTSRIIEAVAKRDEGVTGEISPCGFAITFKNVGKHDYILKKKLPFKIATTDKEERDDADVDANDKKKPKPKPKPKPPIPDFGCNKCIEKKKKSNDGFDEMVGEDDEKADTFWLCGVCKAVPKPKDDEYFRHMHKFMMLGTLGVAAVLVISAFFVGRKCARGASAATEYPGAKATGVPLETKQNPIVTTVQGKTYVQCQEKV
jgi:hypothetical protein